VAVAWSGRSTGCRSTHPKRPLELEVQVRYRSAPVQALLTPLEPSLADAAAGRPARCQLQFKEEQFSITPGQAAVFYDGAVLLGGGLIQPEPATAASHQ